MVRSLLAILIAACGSADGGDPSRNWSGRYGTRVVGASTDCFESQSPPPLTGFILDLAQTSPDSVTVSMNPIIRLAGRYEGDRLEAGMVVEEPVGLPDSIAARATPADSLDTITYALRADFEAAGFEGEYVIRSPDLRALVTRGEGSRCEYRYRLSGQRMEVG
ncbi:MAG TPA: hypothetical protein VM737_03010 [Gemmatimonadota bacterium]|nr:hypothetical protein [Gemmatimonadota bacterium]